MTDRRSTARTAGNKVNPVVLVVELAEGGEFDGLHSPEVEENRDTHHSENGTQAIDGCPDSP